MIPPEESDCIPQPEPAYSVLNEPEDRELKKLVNAHNKMIDDVVDDFKAKMDELKDDVKQQKMRDEREANSRKRKLNTLNATAAGSRR
eukprot:gene25768-32258_t